MEEPVQNEGDDAPEGEAIMEDSDHSDEEVEEDPPNASGSGNSLDNSTPNPVPPPAETSFGGSILSSDFNYGSYMGSIGSRLKTILNNIRPKSDPTTRLLSLQELSELLSMSNEDSLSGYFSADAYVKELVHIMGGPRKSDDEDGNDGEGDSDLPQDEDAALAAALAISGGGFMGEENLEEQLLACRCLANLIEAMPGSAYTLVHNGAVAVLCSKLLAIQFIDLAEQTISVRLFTHAIPPLRILTLLFVDARETFRRISESHRARRRSLCAPQLPRLLLDPCSAYRSPSSVQLLPESRCRKLQSRSRCLPYDSECVGILRPAPRRVRMYVRHPDHRVVLPQQHRAPRDAH